MPALPPKAEARSSLKVGAKVGEKFGNGSIRWRWESLPTVGRLGQHVAVDHLKHKRAPVKIYNMGITGIVPDKPFAGGLNRSA